MRRILKWLRGNSFINLVIRRLLKQGFHTFQKGIYRWPVNGNVKVECEQSYFFLKTHEDESIANSWYYFGSSEEQRILNIFIKNSSQRASCLFDVGANIGYYSLLMACSDPRNKIFAFEPHPSNFKRLNENITLNNRYQIHPLNVALGKENEEIRFYAPHGKISVVASFVQEQTEHFESEVTETLIHQSTLDQMIERLKVIPEFVKIDVELFEREVLIGGIELFTRHTPVILIEVHNIQLKLESLKLSREKFESYNEDIESILTSYDYTFYGLYTMGIYRLESIQHHPELKNVICAKKRTRRRFYSRGNINDFVNEIFEK